VIIGDIGSEEHTVFTALGDSVNVAARLQDMTKALSCEVVVSGDVLKTAHVSVGDLPQIEVPIRGRVEPLIVYTVKKAGMLSDMVADFAVAAA
jgi:adenylate cyclase